LLIRFEEKLQKLTDSINELSKNILSMRWLFMKFYLDFGHGGKDSGAVGFNGTF
jgi:N-acetylmuramoyl-L-alanine amidase